MPQSFTTYPCPRCRKPVIQGAKACMSCGLSFVDPQHVPQPPPQPVQPIQQATQPLAKDPANNPAGAIIAAIIVLGAVFFVGPSTCGTFGGGNPSRISDVKFGMSKDEVRELLGTPSNDQSMNSAGMTMDMWYYGDYQISFTNGKVDSINRY